MTHFIWGVRGKETETKEKREKIYFAGREGRKRGRGAKEKGRQAGRKNFTKSFGLKFNSVI